MLASPGLNSKSWNSVVNAPPPICVAICQEAPASAVYKIPCLVEATILVLTSGEIKILEIVKFGLPF